MLLGWDRQKASKGGQTGLSNCKDRLQESPTVVLSVCDDRFSVNHH
jgi:hypothetical protein